MGIGPYGSACRGGRPCPPSPGNATLCRAGPVCPAVGAVRNPPVTASPCQPPLGKGAMGVRSADCHTNDRSRRNSRVIPRPVRRLVVGIRNTPAQIQRGTDCHSQCAHWLRNDRFITRGAVDNRRCSVLSPPLRWQNFLPRFICIPAYIFRQSHQHRPGTSQKNLCVYLIFPGVTIFSSCREYFFVLCSV